MLRIRVRSKAAGVENMNIDSNMSLLDFAKQLQDTTKVPYLQQKLLTGFPPVSLELASMDLKVPVSSLFHTGDVITVEMGTASAAAAPQTTTPQPTNPQSTTPQPPTNSQPQPQPTSQTPTPSQPPSTSQQPTEQTQKPYKAPPPATRGSIQHVTEGKVVRRKIADDNSCLFNAVGYVLEGDAKSKATLLRSLVAHIITNSEEYSEAMLGKSKQEYTSWIMLPNSWGGGIEVSILSEEYKTEICAFDISSKVPFCYGEGQGYTQRVYLLYDGIHYDALTINLLPDEAPAELDITVFAPNDEVVKRQMASFVESLNKAGQFTNMATFQILCGDCNKILHGEKEVAIHAATTGHSKFVEVK